jgi:hypothetical protein
MAVSSLGHLFITVTGISIGNGILTGKEKEKKKKGKL